MTKSDRATRSATDILAVIRAPLEQYPPSLNQVALLLRQGFRVTVIDLFHEDYPEFPFPHSRNLVRVRAGQHQHSLKERTPSLAVRLWRAAAFTAKVRVAIGRQHPQVVLAYDPNAMLAVGKQWNGRKPPAVVWHFHEFFDSRSAQGGWISRKAVRFAEQFADKANLSLFPDRHRAQCFEQNLGKPLRTLEVMNCPLRTNMVPASRLREILSQERVPNDAQIVFFQGWIGRSRCFEDIIQSMIHWPSNAWLVLVGPVSDVYRGELLRVAQQAKCEHRILFIAAVPYQELSALTAGATLGLSIVSGSEDPNWRFSAGAINKRFEYMAAGLPQIANMGPGMKDIIEKPGVGLLVDPHCPKSIGHGVARILSSPTLLQQMRASARRAHLDTFCYEHQFAPVLEKLKEMVRMRVTGTELVI